MEMGGWEGEVSQARVLFLEQCHITDTVGRQCWHNFSVSSVLWGWDSWISLENLPADSSTAVREEDSFSLI